MQNEPLEQMTQIVVRVPVDLKDELAKLAASEDRTLSNYVRRLITDHAEVAR